MNIMGKYPEACELDAITAAAISACDPDDGVVDGLISDMAKCNFDPITIVGTKFNCSGVERQISADAAMVANATWAGPQSLNGSSLWYGPNRGANLSGNSTTLAVATTQCSNNGTCVGKPNYLGADWLSLFVEKNPDYDLANMTQKDYVALFLAGADEYSNIATDNPDLTAYFARGGKILGYHGLVRIHVHLTVHCSRLT
jgi:hypothetical protein